MSQPFSMSVAEQPGGLVATLSGMATVQAREEFDERLAELKATPSALIVLDLAGLEFLTSHGLGSFLALHADRQTRGGGVRIAAPNEYIRNLIKATRVDQKLRLYESVADALQG